MKCLKSDFSTRPRKRKLENFRGKQVTEKGGLALLKKLKKICAFLLKFIKLLFLAEKIQCGKNETKAKDATI